MPMDFPDTKSLKKAAEDHKFRQCEAEETEEQYREALAKYGYAYTKEIKWK